MSLYAKIWGSTEPLILTPMFEMHRLRVKPFHRCSRHVHKFKHNAFYVIEGSLYIDFELKSELLGPGDYLTVAPGVVHQFRSDSIPVVLLEMYYTEPLSEDIIRHNVGAAVAPNRQG